MTDWLPLAYPWIKAAHLIFVIFWMAGLFMLPRYFIYHQESAPGSPEDALWIAREERMARIILNPAMLMVWIFGFALAYITDVWEQPWFIAKIAVVILLSAYQGWLMRYRKMLAAGQRTASGRTLRILNEAPGLAVALIVILVIIRPFA